MYGQKQIFQCLAVVALVTILNFYRSAIQRNKEIQKYKLQNARNKQMDGRSPILDKIDFTIAIHSGNFLTDFCCGHILFKFDYDHLINRQCNFDCCIDNRSMAILNDDHLTSLNGITIETNATANEQDILNGSQQFNLIDDESESDTSAEMNVITLDFIKKHLVNSNTNQHDDNGIFSFKSEFFNLVFRQQNH